MPPISRHPAPGAARRTLRGALVVAGTFGLLASCSRRADAPHDPRLAFRSGEATPPAPSTTAATPAAAAVTAVDPTCPTPRTVRAPAEGTPEAAVAEVYRAALAPDTEASFQRFAAAFSAVKKERFLREQLWPRARAHVGKYVRDAQRFSFDICRTESRAGQMKIFVRSFDPAKSHPPIRLVREGAGWRIDFFTW